MTSGSCANPTVPIIFSPMHSAFIQGSSAQTFSLPAITGDNQQATWSLSDPTQANLQGQSFVVDGAQVPGVMITIAGPGDANGQITVIARESSGACGSAVLNVTKYTESDWTIGNARYNDGVSLVPTAPDGGATDGGFSKSGLYSSDGGYFQRPGGTACTNCHGPTAQTGPFKDVSHTPEQTAGFSDSDLASIILKGVVPDGGYFNPTILKPNCASTNTDCAAEAYAEWQLFHKWSDIDPQAQLPGIICYLRSLAPEPQSGTSNFGGHHHHDGGAPPPPPSTDAGAGGDGGGGDGGIADGGPSDAGIGAD